MGLTVALCLATWGPAFAAYIQTNLVSNATGPAPVVDPNLVNPWGLASGPGTPLWVADNEFSVATLYSGTGVVQTLVVSLPFGSPTGVTSNPTGEFLLVPGANNTSALFMFSTEAGTIDGWNPGVNLTAASVAVNHAGAVYTGLTLGVRGAQTNTLYAANFRAATIEAFDSAFSPVSLPGAFTDPNLPRGFAPYNIQNIGGILYVTYARQDAAQLKALPGAEAGFIDKYTTDGALIGRLVSRGVLNAPWGIALAPAGFGEFANDLLVGNFGDGTINAFDPDTGALLGTLEDANGVAIINAGLRGLIVGNGANGQDPNALFFTADLTDTAGAAGVDITDTAGAAGGLFGELTAAASVPEPASFALIGIGLAGLGLRRRMLL
ncbi:MAG TPA: TIGR03118 family protein [Burkholderiales bacterium]|nr:TIGR03118 family protein [Burkholderiales bacterium]